MFIVDEAESELALLDLIQVVVEVLDKCFENVCELDLIFNPDKVIIEGVMVVVELHNWWDYCWRDGDRD